MRFILLSTWYWKMQKYIWSYSMGLRKSFPWWHKTPRNIWFSFVHLRLMIEVTYDPWDYVSNFNYSGEGEKVGKAVPGPLLIDAGEGEKVSGNGTQDGWAVFLRLLLMPLNTKPAATVVPTAPATTTALPAFPPTNSPAPDPIKSPISPSSTSDNLPPLDFDFFLLLLLLPKFQKNNSRAVGILLSNSSLIS